MARALGHDAVYLAARDPATAALVGVLPLVRVRSLLFGHYLESMPFLNYGGPIGEPGAVQTLALRAEKIARDEGVGLLELRSRGELPLDMPASLRKITVLLDLPDDPEILWKDLPAKVRSQVRRPRKEGVEVRFGADQVADFWAVFSEHMRDLGTPTHSESLFRTIAEVFPDDVVVAVARLGGKPVACGWGFRWGEETEITWASALRAYSRTAPNMLLYWAFMERAIESGCRTFNFGRCTPGGGTHRFKKQWGGRDEQLHWYQRARAAETASTPSPDEGLWSLGPRIWSQLPLALTRRLGPHVVRWIP
jgi:FemAB-related protein (PEP-CTERM system-associated)